MKKKEMQSESEYRKGFTIVELSLSLVFISTLSLTVVLVIAGAVSSYHKSITLNQINTTGTSLVDDMRHSIQESPSTKLENMCDNVFGSQASDTCKEDGARRFVSVSKVSRVTLGEKSFDAPVFGALCTGTYSYIWNSGYFFNKEYTIQSEMASLKYSADKPVVSGFKLLKIADDERAVCISAVRKQNGNVVSDNYENNDIKPDIDVTLQGLIKGGANLVFKDDPEELLSGEETGMALYDLSVSVAEQTGLQKNMYYYTSFILGTVQGGINVDASGESCAAPASYSGLSEDFDYCAINKFNFAALANGGKK